VHFSERKFVWFDFDAWVKVAQCAPGREVLDIARFPTSGKGPQGRLGGFKANVSDGNFDGFDTGHVLFPKDFFGLADSPHFNFLWLPATYSSLIAVWQDVKNRNRHNNRLAFESLIKGYSEEQFLYAIWYSTFTKN
jgi:hypothetical protein